MRLDAWLDISCLFRTRSEAQRACTLGRVIVNDQSAKPHRLVRVGDAVSIARPLGRRQRIVVQALAERHMKRSEARQLYVDQTPPPTPEELELWKLERLYRDAARTARAPHKRDRRALRALKGKA